jgi:hypothetical protein
MSMSRVLTSWLMALAFMANIGVMLPVRAQAVSAVPSMNMAAMQAAKIVQHPECRHHHGHKSVLVCDGCALCVGAKLPDSVRCAGPVPFAEMQTRVPIVDASAVHSFTHHIERPPKAQG